MHGQVEHKACALSAAGRWASCFHGYVLSFKAARISLGILLLVAAFLKLYGLLTDASSMAAPLDSKWLDPFVITVELVLAVWLLSGVNEGWSWVAAITVFSAFASYSAYAFLMGKPCGCFGPVSTNPLLPLMIDLGAIGVLLFARRDRPVDASAGGYPPSPYMTAIGAVLFCVGVGGLLIVAVPTFVLGGLTREPDVVVLEPEKWLGQRFPLLEHIDIGDQLAHGEWTVLLYHQECPKCQQWIANYDASLVRNDFSRLALIELPPYGSLGTHAADDRVLGRLSDNQLWWCTTPLRCELVEGQVTKVVFQ